MVQDISGRALREAALSASPTAPVVAALPGNDQPRVAAENENDEPASGFFPSINQFRSTVKAERDWAAYHNVAPRKRVFVGTVKLHGTNAGISLLDGQIVYRSRTREITPDDDNSGFARHMSAHEAALREMLSAIGDDVSIFGEWCGAGVQSSVGISAEQKLFVTFALRINGDWVFTKSLPSLPDARIFNVFDFPHWELEIDFDKPEQAQNELVSLTEAVEAECPVAKAFGHCGIGEGIVWTPADGDRDSRYWFKVKGEKHSASKVKVLAAVDVERFRQRDELIAAIVTENRLRQGLDIHVNEFGREIDIRFIGDYLRWVFNDVAKEEADMIAASGFEQKELGKGISDIAKRFYIAAVNEVASA